MRCEMLLVEVAAVHYDRDLHVCHDEVNSAATTQSTRILKQIHATKYIMQIFLYPLHVLRRKILSWILCTYFVLDVAFALLLWNFLSLNESSKKVKLSICLTEYDAMKAYWVSGIIAPCILDLGTK